MRSANAPACGLSVLTPDQIREDETMKATKWRRGARLPKRRVSQTVALFAASIALAHCTAVPPEDPTQPVPPENYGALVSTTLKGFKGFPDYRDFGISGLRWVHAASGWNWLTCVRYVDHGQQRFYAFFINGNSVVNARYDVRTDQCAAQQYQPFDAAAGAIRSPAPPPQQPIY
jgi:hypothetical protein